MRPQRARGKPSTCEGEARTDGNREERFADGAVAQPGREKPPGAGALEECRTGPYLIGRLVGLACHLAARRDVSCRRYADKIARCGVPATPLAIANLNRMLARDLARHGIPAAYRAAAEDIASLLGEIEAWPALPWPPASAAAAEFVFGQHHQSKPLTDALSARG